jgi:hypothetical protein
VAPDIEEMLRRYAKPSSDSEQERQDAAEQLVRDAVKRSPSLSKLGSMIEILPKGSYANNTNVKLDSDVDIAVVSHEVFYPDYSALSDADQARLKSGPPSSWVQPATLRSELIRVLQGEAGPSNVHPGRVAIQVDAVKARRTSADVVPSFEYRRYFYRSDRTIGYHEGNKVFTTSGPDIINWPKQQYTNGVTKNKETSTRFKQLVRVMKNIENDLVKANRIRELASYFVECLVYNVENPSFNNTTITADTRNVITLIFNATNSDDACKEWVEVNWLKWLFRSGQSWIRSQANAFALAAWQYLGFS